MGFGACLAKQGHGATEASGCAIARRTGRREDWQALIVCALAVLLYASLHAELPIDDTDRFSPSIAAGVFEWDASHLLMQPAVVLWHRFLSFGDPARSSQERFNAFCAALSLGIFYLLLFRLGVGVARRVLLTALAALSYNLLNLATSGHIKLAVLPFLAVSLYHATLWEGDERGAGTGGTIRLTAAAVGLGIAAAFLINSILVMPFLALAIVAVSLRAGHGMRRVLGRALGFAGLCGATALTLLGAAYLLVGGGPATPGGFLGFVFAKSAQRPPFAGVESLARGVFGVVQNFVYAGDFGAMLRTWMSGDAFSPGSHLRSLLTEGAIFLVAAVLLAWIYGEGLARLARGRGVAAVPWAFVLGALAFAIPWNLNESDFYFQITFPTVALMASAPPAARWRTLYALLLALVAGTVLLGWALPKRRYPLSRYNAELQARLTPQNLAVHWYNYTGGPSLIFMRLPGVPRLHPDRIYELDPDPGRFFPRLARALDRQLVAGGRVYLFGILDDRSWNAPWPTLRRKGLTPARLEAFFRDRYTVVDRGEMAEIPCWELLPKPHGP
ncbi:MAG TPA: hypothetical protein VGG03_16470 [Thermoanaerobaculia bacterium]|jgi:hypothetical protein